MEPGEIYFNLLCNSSNYGNPDYMIKFCKNCWDKLYNDTLFDYENKKLNYKKYLKKRIVANL
jgi:hypothetical protein